mgnify:FL=1
MTLKELFDYYVSLGFTPEGAAGLLANIKAESNLNPKNLQNSFNKKMNITDEEYTERVDNGSYTNFVHDSAGYGLVQWTYWSRKQNLLNYAKARGVSIGDMEMQASFIYQELKGYTGVFSFLGKAESVVEACDKVMTEYEKPANQSEKARESRRMYARDIYQECYLAEQEEKAVTEKEIRWNVVNIAAAWYGCKEADGSHKAIINLYNSFKPLPRGAVVKYTDSWCATFVSAVAIKAGYTDIIPRECSCGKMIALFQKLNRWVENDAYVPEAGDIVFYDWNDSGVGDNTGWPDHVGIVVSVSDAGVIKVIEGNTKDQVGYREIKVNGKYIRGYGVPDYASKATADAPEDKESADSTPVTQPEGTGSQQTNSNKGGLSMKPAWVGIVTADSLNVRKWAGKEYAKLKSVQNLHKGEAVEVCDQVKAKDGDIWLYVRIEGKTFGFVHSKYIKKAESTGTASGELKVGQEVQFTGSTHYASAVAKTGKKCSPGKAKVTAVYASGKHPYHLVNVKGGGSTVYGWVNAADIKR